VSTINFQTSEETCQMSDGFKIFLRHWKPAQKSYIAILCIPGFGGNSRLLTVTCETFSQSGVEPYALDLRGFGNSVEEGLPRGDTKDFKRHLKDIDETVQNLRTNFRRFFMLGWSLGALYAVWYGAHFPTTIDGFILYAPAIEVKPRTSEEDRKRMPMLLQTAPQTMLSSTSKARFADPLNTNSFSARYLFGIGSTLMRDKALQNATNIQKPTLIVQGDADEEALPIGAQRLHETLAVKDKTLMMISGADHLLYSFDPEKRQQIYSATLQWIREHS
jgi:alpha-beta hydrolase superfamily lysophospholipase